MADILLIMLKLLFWGAVMGVCLFGLCIMVRDNIPKETRLALFIGVLSLSNIAWWEIENITYTVGREYEEVCK